MRFSHFSLKPQLRTAGVGAVLVGSLVLTGCASTQATHPQDPFEGYNRAMTTFNDNVDKAILKPVATGYQTVVPPVFKPGESVRHLPDVAVEAPFRPLADRPCEYSL